MLSPLYGVGLINAIIFGVYGSLLRVQMKDNGKPAVEY